MAANDKVRARQLGATIVKPLVFRSGSHQGPMLMHYFRAVSLKAEYEQTVRWLQDEFSEKKGEIEWELGASIPALEWSESHPLEYVPASQPIPELRDQLKRTVDAAAARAIRRKLAWACANAGHYADAAKVIAVDVIEPASFKGAPLVAVNSDTLSWCIWKRRADAEALYEKDPQQMASIHSLIDIGRLANMSAQTPVPRRSKTRWQPSVPG